MSGVEGHDDLRSLAPESITLRTLIAKGGFATCYKGVCDSRVVAVKVVPRLSPDSHARYCFQSFLHECKLMQDMNHGCDTSMLMGIRMAVWLHGVFPFGCGWLTLILLDRASLVSPLDELSASMYCITFLHGMSQQRLYRWMNYSWLPLVARASADSHAQGVKEV